MQTIRIDLNNPDQTVLQKAAVIIANGGIVVHPTDTAYGLATNALSSKAAKKIFALKGRVENKGLIVAVRDKVMAEELVTFTPLGYALFSAFLPGPLTLLLSKKALVPSGVSGGSDKLAIRIPNCPVTLLLSKLCLVPYTTTSANPSGGRNPYSLADVTSQFSNELLSSCDLFLDCGVLSPTPPSTIIDATKSEPTIIRPGPITLEEIRMALQ